MTPQEIFDKVVTHLFSMPKQSIVSNENGGSACVYRAPGGLKCAVGALIPDDVYRPWMDGNDDGDEYGYVEGNWITDLLRNRPEYFPAYFSENGILLMELQAIHDTCSNWDFDKNPGPFDHPINTVQTREHLQRIAHDHELNTDVLGVYPQPRS